MFCATGSDAGKSILATALCRILKQDGYHPAPFKAQNMALNSYVTPDGCEIGRAQAVQAEAAGVEIVSDMNPILLKPQSDHTSQVILNGHPIGNRSAYSYFRNEGHPSICKCPVEKSIIMRPVYQVADRLKIGCKRTLSTLQWTLLSVLSGVIIGLIGTAFYFGIVWVTGLRQSHPYFLLLLPFGSMLILFIYHLADRDHPGGTDLVLSSIREGSYIPLRMTPLIFISTIFSHLCGASVGREGAALQLGGSIGNTMARIFRLEESERRILVLSGMAAAFSALMGTPLAGAVFAMEITSVGVMYYPALLPTVVSAFTAHYIALLMGQPIPHYDFNLIPDFTIAPVLKISIVGVAAGFAAILFILALRYTKKYIASPLGNRYLRAFILGSVLLILTAITTYVEGDSQSYNGAGMDMIHLAIEGRSPWYAFLMKILFTALSIAAAYKGGEIVP